jgi:c-di-GMP-binding flagellar brake protein YcgR
MSILIMDNGQEFIITILLSARDDGLVFDMGGDEKANRLLASAKNCTFLTYSDGIKVQFSCTKPQRFLWGNEEAFWVEIPTYVI